MTSTNTAHPGEAWSRDLMCHWRRLEALSDTHLRVYLPPSACTDMQGMIRIACTLMPRVKRIETYSGEMPDAVYVRQARGEWVFQDGRPW